MKMKQKSSVKDRYTHSNVGGIKTRIMIDDEAIHCWCVVTSSLATLEVTLLITSPGCCVCKLQIKLCRNERIIRLWYCMQIYGEYYDYSPGGPKYHAVETSQWWTSGIIYAWLGVKYKLISIQLLQEDAAACKNHAYLYRLRRVWSLETCILCSHRTLKACSWIAQVLVYLLHCQ